MPLTHHPLVKEFPEHKDLIHARKVEDQHFAQLMDKYEELDKSVYRIESGEEPTGDERLDALKVERVALKDELYKLISA
ncbi:DUF465 domain-containing protein [Granulosicoccaceae sp. 1_MG-2023]|nr:DUF465 domain-containing protein [Granulosicoccaceae sp. 1_MG-2023]